MSIIQNASTPIYQLRASKKYYENNKNIIKSKALLKTFRNNAERILKEIENNTDILVHDEIYRKLKQITSYKIYQIDRDARFEFKDRILNIVKTLQNVKEIQFEWSFLRLGGNNDEFGSQENTEYIGRVVW